MNNNFEDAGYSFANGHLPRIYCGPQLPGHQRQNEQRACGRANPGPFFVTKFTLSGLQLCSFVPDVCF